eukprot:3803088-Amphidinium_carterae.1
MDSNWPNKDFKRVVLSSLLYVVNMEPLFGFLDHCWGEKLSASTKDRGVLPHNLTACVASLSRRRTGLNWRVAQWGQILSERFQHNDVKLEPTHF